MTQRALTQTSGRRVPVFVVKIAENERWASPPYVYEAAARIGHTARVEPTRVA